MFAKRWVVVCAVLGMMLLMVVACTRTDDEPEGVTGTGSAAGTSAFVGNPGVASVDGDPLRIAGISSESYGVTAQTLGTSQVRGISVSGLGTVTVEPDLAVVSIGVEARDRTVGVARNQAAESMRDILAEFSAHSIDDKDIQTRNFSIMPRYSWRERSDEKGGTYSEQVLVGYTVSNQVTVKVRDLEDVGSVIDGAAKAGGDLIRINDIQFTVEASSPVQARARQSAIEDAINKAKQFAELTGVTLGRPIYMTEDSATQAAMNFPMEARAMQASPYQPTVISGGELDVQSAVRIVFSIQ